MDRTYHRAVLVEQVVEHLQIRPCGAYVDATCGGGGHARRILADLTDGHLYAFDQDADSIAHASSWQQEATEGMFTLIADNFRNILSALAREGVEEVDGILADLGVSAHQLSVPERGFSINAEGPLDMRMCLAAERTAADILNTYSVDNLRRLLQEHADIVRARTIAQRIADGRKRCPLTSTLQLRRLLQDFAPVGRESKFFARVFQAIRIEVNDELMALQHFLRQCVRLIKTGGRLVVISYHSCEDRLVKRFFRHGSFAHTPATDAYGRHHKPFHALLRMPLTPSPAEVMANPAARSAKLRVAVRGSSAQHWAHN